MKTFRFFIFLFSVLAISAVFFACDTTEDPPAPSLAPSISVQLPTVTAKNVDVYEDISFAFTCSYNLNTKKALSKVTMIAKFSNPTKANETLMDTLVPAAYSNSWTLQYMYSVPGNAPENQVINIVISCEDKDGQIATRTYNFTVKYMSDVWDNNLEMGAQSNTTLGSYYRSDSNKIMLSSQAKQPSYQKKVDFVFVYDEINLNGDCIAAPNSTIVSDQVVDLCGPFTTKNATLFKQLPPMTDEEYNKIRTAAAIAQLFNNGAGNGTAAIKTLTDGSSGTDATVFVFKTVDNKYGISKITEVVLGNPQMKNSLKLNVKVSKK